MINSNNIYYGIIVDNKDPLYELRCKVRVFGVFDEISDEDLPWAHNEGSLVFGSKGYSGALSVPKIGSIVRVKFINNDIYSIIYSNIFMNVDENIKEILKKSYENTHILLYDDDVKIKFYYSKIEGYKIENENTHINIKNNNIHIKTTNVNIDINENGEINIKTNNNIFINSDKDINIECENANIKSKNVVVDSGNIELGKNANESLILGDSFMKLFNMHTHVGNLGAPTGPPITLMTDVHLSKISKTKLT